MRGAEDVAPYRQIPNILEGQFTNFPTKFLPMLAVWVEIPLAANPHALFACPCYGPLFARGCYPPKNSADDSAEFLNQLV